MASASRQARNRSGSRWAVGGRHTKRTSGDGSGIPAPAMMADPMAAIALGTLVWPRREPRPQWLERYGPLLLALFMLAASRWGRYLLPGPPYIGDVVLGLLLANAALAAAVRGGARGRIDPLLGLVTGLLVLWVGIELLSSSFTQTALS